MVWDWVPARENDGTPPPSRRLGTVVTVLCVVLAAVMAVYWIAGPAGATKDECVANRPDGVEAGQVAVVWQWWPPKRVCHYDGATV